GRHRRPRPPGGHARVAAGGGPRAGGAGTRGARDALRPRLARAPGLAAAPRRLRQPALRRPARRRLARGARRGRPAGRAGPRGARGGRSRSGRRAVGGRRGRGRLLPALGGEGITVGRPAMRRLAGSVAVEAACVLAILGVVTALGVSPPARHEQPDWPLGFRLALGALADTPDARPFVLIGS